MQNHVKYLVIDDQPEWAQAVNDSVRDYFVDEKRFAPARVRGKTAYDAAQANQRILERGWDLVMLDMNLGPGAGKDRISGLDLLGEIARLNSAYFVIVVTGAVTDPTVENVYGPETGALLRFGAMNEATRRMSPSRIRIVHKPDVKSVAEAMESLVPHLHSALDQYCSVNIERNIFRPLPGETGPKPLWEIRYNGGPTVTLLHTEPFRMIQSALSQPNRALKVIQLMQALAHSSGKAGPVEANEGRDNREKPKIPSIDNQGHQQDEVNAEEGLDWEQMASMAIKSHAPVQVRGGTIPIESVIEALLNAVASGDDALKRAVESFADTDIGEEPLLGIPSVAAEWARRAEAASAEFGITDAPAELMDLVRRLKPLLAPIRERWIKKRAAQADGGKPKKDKGKVRVAKAKDTPEMALARQHWKRFQTTIARRPALHDFSKHVKAWVPRDPSTKGYLHYRPPGDTEFMPFWLTE